MRAIRAWLLVFVVGLVLSGVTAFPLVAEVRLLSEVLRSVPAPDGLVAWVDRVRDGLVVTGATYPFMAYGTDWLAFAHLGIIPLIVVRRLVKRLTTATATGFEAQTGRLS